MGRQTDIDYDFASSTSFHGVHHLVKNKSRPYKFIWLLLIMCAMAVCIWQITDRIKNYLTYPTNTNIELIHNKPLKFPAVTFCSPYRYNNKTLSSKDRQFLELTKKHLDLLLNDFATSEENWKHLQEEATNMITHLESLYSGNFNFSEIIFRTSFAFTNQTLKKCIFAGENCTIKNFFMSFSSQFDTCWTFNSEHIPLEKNTQKRTGEENGLQIILDIQIDEYMPPLLPDHMAFKFFVHSSYDYPFLKGTGSAISPGLQAFAALQFQKNLYMDQPYGKCNRSAELQNFKNYTMANCITECKTQYVMEHCKCRPLFFPSKDIGYPVCDFVSLITCIGNLNIDNEDDICPQCEVQCIEENYSMAVTYAQAQENDNFKVLASNYGVDSHYLQRNFIFLNVFYDSFIFIETKQSPAIIISSLISDIGGQLGLFLGVSVLTLSEIIEYINSKLMAKMASRRSKQMILPPPRHSINENSL